MPLVRNFPLQPMGDDQESALRNTNDAIQLWIDTARELGHSVPKPKGERLIFA